MQSLQSLQASCCATDMTLLGNRGSRPGSPAFRAFSCNGIQRRQQQQQCSKVQQGLRRCTARRLPCAPLLAYSENPQNVDSCQVMPSPQYSAEEAVRIQLEALQQNDSPWGNHGVQTAYEWAFDVGGLDPSMYFAFPKDLYHFDHFMGMFANRLPELINCSSFQISGVQEGQEGPVVLVEVQGSQGQRAELEFHLRRKAVGAKKGSLMTHMIRRTTASAPA